MIQDQEIELERERLFQPRHKASGIPPREYEDRVREVVTNYIGYQRTEAKLRKAVAELRSLAGQEQNIRARDYHELMRVHEARNVREVAEMVATAALERRESRGGYSHFRADYPQSDDANWLKTIVLKKGASGYESSYRPVNLELFGKERVHADID